MRRFVLLFCFVVLAFSLPALAGGVLLPKDSGGASSLGLIPQSETQPIEAAKKKSDNTEEIPTTEQILNRGLGHTETGSATAPSLSGVPAPQSVSSYSASTESNANKRKMSQPLTPGGVVAGDARQKADLAHQIATGQFSPYKTNDAGAVVPANIAEFMKKHERDPVVMDEIEVPSPVKGDKSLMIGISQKYEWGSMDAHAIERVFGYSADEIPQVCQLRIDATVETDVSRLFFKGVILSGTKTPIEYAGNIKAVTLQPVALCKIPKTLPRSGMLILKVGDYYSTMLLGRKSCEHDSIKLKKEPRALLVRYAGERDKTACIFE